MLNQVSKMESSITSSPEEYKAELIAIFEHRVNNRLESIFELMGVECEATN